MPYEITAREAEWMERKHQKELLRAAQNRIAKGRHRGSRRTQLSLEVFAELVELAQRGAQSS